MALERIQVRGPEPPERGQPGIHFLQWPGPQPVETTLCIHHRFHEPGLAQHPQMFGHGRLRYPKPSLDLSNRSLRRDQEAQDRAAVRLGNDFEDGLHAVYILYREYTCQGI